MQPVATMEDEVVSSDPPNLPIEGNSGNSTQDQHQDDKDNGPSQQAVPSFPLQRLPFEVQMLVFEQVIRKPLTTGFTHFCDLILVTDRRDKTRFKVSFSPLRVSSQRDDSVFREHEQLAKLCSASYRAIYGTSGPVILRFARSEHKVYGARDLLCLTNVTGFDNDSRLSRTVDIWHPSLHVNQTPTIDHAEVQQLFGGVQKIAFMSSEKKFSNNHWWPQELAWFIDCCLDIEEFYILYQMYDVRPQNTSSNARNFRTWSETRPLNVSVSRFTGRTRSCIEIHNPFKINESKYGPVSTDHSTRRANIESLDKAGCECGLSPACSELPRYICTRDTEIFLMMMETKRSLLEENPTLPWKLSRAKRENLKLGMLVQYGA